FKAMPQLNLARDDQRAREVQEAIAARGLESRFGVIEHLTTLGSLLRFQGPQHEVVSVRRFVRGRTLRRTLETDPARGLRALNSTIEFLAFFHGLEPVEEGASFRREMWRSNLGRWLKQIAGDDGVALGLFNRW